MQELEQLVTKVARASKRDAICVFGIQLVSSDVTMAHHNQHERATPVNVVNTGSAHDDPRTPEDGIALCLSGGGYRAMLFHVGSLWRLNELGMLPKLARISSVSGGSITAGVLGHKWRSLAFDANGVSPAFQREIVTPIRELADRTLDEGAILSGIFTPGQSQTK
jgi:predicted acylesterase/phospholipase RssA